MIYQLKITLSYSKPPIWRRVLVPASYTLAQLHDIIQIAMGWTNSHLHSFEIRGQNYSPKMEFDDDYDDCSDLFRMARLNTAEFNLEQVLKKKGRMIYFYDFGDSWEHLVLAEDVLEKSELKLPLCVKLVGACPPEDSGGIPGYYEKLKILKNPKHSEYKDVKAWMGPYHNEIPNLESINSELTQLFK